MAHSYSSNPLYTGTPSFTPQQLSYYPSYPSNGPQQSMNPTPAMPQQPAPGQAQPQMPPALQQQQPPSLTNLQRFDATSQIHPPAPPFPPFPPLNFNSDFFKQFATQAYPPLPPNLPAMPMPSPGYSQLHASMNNSTPSAYSPYNTAASQGFGSSFAQPEQLRQHSGDPVTSSQQGTNTGMEWQRESQGYGVQMDIQSRPSYAARPISKGTDIESDQLPSFGSRSDLDMLFATAQQQRPQVMAERDVGVPQISNGYGIEERSLAIDGGASPYDPARPATIQARSSSFATSNDPPRKAPAKMVERIYENKSPTELRQLAKGAVLSLVPHKILYSDLVKEGVDSQVLRELYAELGLKVESEQVEDHTTSQQPREIHRYNTVASIPKPPTPETHESTQHFPSGQPSIFPSSTASMPPTSIPTPPAVGDTLPTQALLDARKQQAPPNANLERKDRIAQLLAAKAGRPTPPPMTNAPTSSESSAGPAPEADTASSQQPPSSRTDIQVLPQAANVSKSRAQPDLLKQKMEQLKREAQAKTGIVPVLPSAAQLQSLSHDSQTSASRPAPQFGSVTPLALSNVDMLASQPAITSLIPGLFMSSAEASGLEESGNIVLEKSVSAGRSAAATTRAEATGQPSSSQSASSSTVPAKRSPESEPRPFDFQPPSKRPNLQQDFRRNASGPSPDNDDDYQSEGEVVEELESDAMAVDPEPEQSYREYQPSASTTAATFFANQQSAAEQSSATSGPGSDKLYRAKQTEIEAMRRMIAEMEQRNKLKRTRSQMDSPSSSKPNTPAVAGEDQQLGSSPIPQPLELGGNQRQVSGARIASKLTRAQLQERTAALRAEVLKQRAQRQQVLQEGLPDLNAEVQKAENRLDTSREELRRVRAQIHRLKSELGQLAKQEANLQDEVARHEEQLEGGREGQKQYADELQQIKLEKLAEEQAAPQQDSLAASIPAVPPGPPATFESLPGLSNGHTENPLSDVKGEHNLSTLPSDSISMAMPAQNNMAVPPKDLDTSLTSHQIDAPSHGSTGFTDTGAGELQRPEIDDDTEMGVEVVGASKFEGLETHAQNLAAEEQFEPVTEDAPEADEMEISPEPDDYQESHENIPTVGTAQDDYTPNPANDDSDGSASMSGSDDENEDEDDYEPAEADTSQPMQQSDGDDEYDPEEVPMDSGTPSSGDVDSNGAPEATETYGTGPNIRESEPVINNAVWNDSGFAPEAEVTGDDATAVSEVPIDTQDDNESGTQLMEADAVAKATPPQAPTDDTTQFLDGQTAPSVHYVPYKTPLSSFKSYRFHSEYNDRVKSGYRSLTYSNNIDPSRPLCPTELSGQACADPTCEEQHFSQLGLPDEKILVQMSSASDIKDKALRDEFHTGLKQVIADLRAGDVKDFEKVADALSKYRRKFFAEKGQPEKQTAGESNQDADEEKQDHDQAHDEEALLLADS